MCGGEDEKEDEEQTDTFPIFQKALCSRTFQYHGPNPLILTYCMDASKVFRLTGAISKRVDRLPMLSDCTATTFWSFCNAGP